MSSSTLLKPSLIKRRLTPRQLEILDLVAKGTSNKEISSILNISEQTIKNFMTQIFLKLGAFDRAHAVVLAHCSNQLRLECLGQRFVDAAKPHIVQLEEGLSI